MGSLNEDPLKIKSGASSLCNSGRVSSPSWDHDQKGHLYRATRGEILGLVQEGGKWKHLPTVSSLIMNNDLSFEEFQTASSDIRWVLFPRPLVKDSNW